MRSPLQIKASKSTKILKQLMPEGSTISAFFFYDGTVEVPLANSGRIVVAHTNKYPVYEFWQSIIKEPREISAAVDFFYEKVHEPQLYLMQDNWFQCKRLHERSAFFYILNRCSEAGYASCGKIDKDRLKKINIINLKRFNLKNLYPFFDQTEDPLDGLKTSKKTDFILIPMGQYNYNLFDNGKNIGHDMIIIDHKKTKDALEKIDKKWVVVYNKHPAVFKLYENKNIIMIDRYGNKTIDRDKCKEIIINNFVSN